MDASSSRLNYLLHSYLNGTTTLAERQELMDWIKSPLNEEVVKEWIAREMEAAPDERGGRISDARAAQIFSNIVGVERKRTRWMWPAAAAAAVLIIIAGLGSYRFLSGSTKIASALAQPKTHDAPPGSNKAVLLLANGSKIILDNAQVGKLAQQGNVNIVKLDSGKLAYTGSGSNEGLTEVLYNSLSTPRGGQYQLTLPDGTRVWLDAESSIKYPTAFTGTERNVTITGQAYFEVAKNEKMPFIVSAGHTKTTVLGTHFNINAYGDEKTLTTTLLEGAVKVNEKLLHPGEQAVLNNTTLSLTVRGADTYQAVAWKNGQFDFDDMDMPSIMRLISRWYDVNIEFQSNYDGAKFGGGISRQLNLSNVLRLLDKSGVHTRLEDKKLIVLP